MADTNERTKVAKAYGSALIDAIEAHLPKPLRRMDPMTSLKFVSSLNSSAIERLLSSVIAVHADHANPFFEVNRTGAPDEIVVLDAATLPIHEPSTSKLMMYAELIVCPDPLLDHPLALRKLVPDDFNGRWPHTDAQLQELLLQALEFYGRFAFPIREGMVLPTAWHVAVTLQQTIQNNFVGDSSIPAPWDTLSEPLDAIVGSSVTVEPATFDGGKLTIHSFDRVPKSSTSQIALLVKDDPEHARAQMETHLKIVSHETRGDSLFAKIVQAPPDSDALFDGWAEQSKRKVIYNRVTSLRSDLVLASNLDGTVVTLSETNRKLLVAVAGERSPGVADAAAPTAMASMQLPVLDGLSVNQIVTARKDAEALANFRVGFRKACASMKSEIGSASFQREVDAIARDTVEHGLRELGQSYKALRKKSSLDLGLSTALVTISFVGVSLGQLQWLPGVIGGVTQIKSIIDAIPKQDEMRKHPQFMLWNMLRKPFRAGP